MRAATSLLERALYYFWRYTQHEYDYGTGKQLFCSNDLVKCYSEESHIDVDDAWDMADHVINGWCNQYKPTLTWHGSRQPSLEEGAHRNEDGEMMTWIYCPHCGSKVEVPMMQLTPQDEVSCQDCNFTFLAMAFSFSPLKCKEGHHERD